MLSIFNRKKDQKVKKSGKESHISSEELLNETGETTDQAKVETTLSIHPSWNLTTEQQYVLKFLNNELAPLKPNQISLSGIEINNLSDGVEVTAFVRNSLDKGIKIGEVTLLLLDQDKQILARHPFDLSELGEIPAKSSRPWAFAFPSSSFHQDSFSREGWTLAFELKAKHKLDLHESWEQALPEEQKMKLQELFDKINPPKEGEVNFMGFQTSLNDEGDLSVSVFIRNGSNKDIRFEKLPLAVKDATGEIVATGGFALENFEVKANTTKPWTFHFPASLVQKKEPDLTRWSVEVVQG